uniref:HhH-GPD domain-containing protein n=1 Tax=Chenopodium quinoa TaxID=63459 RepID=A0A803MMK2_CHEQI
MAKALCDLQLELQCCSSTVSVNSLVDTKPKVAINRPESFAPGTPAVKESERKRKMHKLLSMEDACAMDDAKDSVTAKVNFARTANGIQVEENVVTTFGSSTRDEINEPTSLGLGLIESSGAASEEIVMTKGNFPSPIELAHLDEKYLAKRCGLGYRAGRVLKLAQGVIEGRIQLDQLEELCKEASLSNYNKLDEKLKEIEGYGPFTRGNVLMCLGFMGKPPLSRTFKKLLKRCIEDMSHINSWHTGGKFGVSMKNAFVDKYIRFMARPGREHWQGVKRIFRYLRGTADIGLVYGNGRECLVTGYSDSDYAADVDTRSEMPSSDYKLITASKMKIKKAKQRAA